MSKSNVTVSLRAVAAEMDLPSDDWTAYLNRRTGELVTVTDEEASAVEDEPGAEDVDGWDVERLRKIRQVLASNEFLPLPTKLDSDEYRIMERFCHQLTDTTVRDEPVRAVKGAGAFGRFKSLARHHGPIEEWHACGDRAFAEIAAAWLDESGIGHTRDTVPGDDEA